MGLKTGHEESVFCACYQTSTDCTQPPLPVSLPGNQWLHFITPDLHMHTPSIYQQYQLVVKLNQSTLFGAKFVVKQHWFSKDMRMGSCLQFLKATEESTKKNNVSQIQFMNKLQQILVIKASHSVRGFHSYTVILNHKAWKVNRIHYRASQSRFTNSNLST